MVTCVSMLRADRRLLIVRGIGLLIASLAVVLLVPAPSPAVGEDIRTLLRELAIQVPSREVSAPSLSLPDTNGAPVRLADYKGRAVMIYFWTTY